jgi:hypothetical protein
MSRVEFGVMAEQKSSILLLPVTLPVAMTLMSSQVFGQEYVNPEAIRYLNRLSDLLFVLARYANINHGGDVKWVPAANRREAPAKRRPEQD